jgi:hypothetical protein
LKQYPSRHDKIGPAGDKSSGGKHEEERDNGIVTNHLNGFCQPTPLRENNSEPLDFIGKGRDPERHKHNGDKNGQQIIWLTDKNKNGTGHVNHSHQDIQCNRPFD